MAGTPKTRAKRVKAVREASEKSNKKPSPFKDPFRNEEITEQQKLFCYAWHATGNASEAYRMSGMGDPDAKHVPRRAMETTRLPQVQEYMKFLEDRALKEHDITIEKLTQNLIEDRQLAFQTEDAKAAIAADLGLAKLHGLLVTKTHTKTESSLDVLIQQARQRAALPPPEPKTLENAIIEGEIVETTARD